jgi:phage-related protein
MALIDNLVALFPIGYKNRVVGTPPLKPLIWVASSKRDLMAMPAEVQDVFGYALYLAQSGSKHEEGKPLRGQGSAAVLEAVEDWQGNTHTAPCTP